MLRLLLGLLILAALLFLIALALEHASAGPSVGTSITDWFANNWRWFALTLVLTLVFASLNFLKMLPPAMRWRPGMIGYFILWVSISFLFAMSIIGAVGSTDAVDLHAWGWDIFFLSLVAAAFPEIAANLRFQFAESAELNIHKYRVQLGNYLEGRFQSEYDAQTQYDLECIAHRYTGRQESLLEKLYLLRLHNKIQGTDLEHLGRLIEAVEQSLESGENCSVASLLSGSEGLGPGLTTLFRKEINEFRVSPVARVMRKLRPAVTIHEARKLVRAGVTGPYSFALRAYFRPLRQRLADKTGLERSRLGEIHRTTRAFRHRQARRTVKWLLVMLIAIMLIAAIYYLILTSTLFAPSDPAPASLS